MPKKYRRWSELEAENFTPIEIDEINQEVAQRQDESHRVGVIAFGREPHIMLPAAYAYVGLEYSLQSAEDAASAITASAPFIFNRSLQIRPQEDSYLV